MIHELCEKYPELYNMAVVCSFYPHILYSVSPSVTSVPQVSMHQDSNAGMVALRWTFAISGKEAN